MSNSLERVAPYRRVRVLASWLFVQTVLILLVFGLMTDMLIAFLLSGLALGAGTAASLLFVFASNRKHMEKAGWRW